MFDAPAKEFEGLAEFATKLGRRVPGNLQFAATLWALRAEGFDDGKAARFHRPEYLADITLPQIGTGQEVETARLHSRARCHTRRSVQTIWEALPSKLHRYAKLPGMLLGRLGVAWLQAARAEYEARAEPWSVDAARRFAARSGHVAVEGLRLRRAQEGYDIGHLAGLDEVMDRVVGRHPALRAPNLNFRIRSRIAIVTQACGNFAARCCQR